METKPFKKLAICERRIGSASIANLQRLYKLSSHCDSKSIRLSDTESSSETIRKAKELERATIIDRCERLLKYR